MKTRTLGQGLKVSAIGYGCMGISQSYGEPMADADGIKLIRYAVDRGTCVFYWIDGPLGYALAGDMDREELQRVARLVYKQLNP